MIHAPALTRPMPMPTPIPITDIDDPRVAVFRDVRDKDLRGHAGFFMAESEMVVRRLLRTPERLHALLLSPSRRVALEAELARVPPSVAVYEAGVDLMTRIAGFHIHRGVLAAGRRPSRADLALDAALGGLRGDGPVCVLIAEGLVNVDNMGALFRNAAAFGAAGVVLDPTCCDPLYRKAIRVSMGHVLSTPWAVSSAWPDDLVRLKEDWGLTIVGAEVDPAARPLWSLEGAERPERVGFLFGSEGHGLSAAAQAACDVLCEIPMQGAPSLNVSVASAVFLYEWTRGRLDGPRSADASGGGPSNGRFPA